MAVSEAADVCSRHLRLCCLTNDGLFAYPGLTNLLMGLKKHVDPSKMTMTLAKPLEEARKELYRHRANWLKWNALYLLLQETLVKPRADLSLQDKKFLETLENQLLVAELKRMLELHSSLPNARPSVLGLETRHLTECLPPHQDMEEMQERLPAELDKMFKARCLDVFNYYHLESDNVGAVAQGIQLGILVEKLATEKKHLKEARAQQEELSGCVEQQKVAYPKVLLSCLGFMRRLVYEFHLGVQSEVDQLNVTYMEIKGRALLLKIRNVEQKILSETYTPAIVNVHKKIRNILQASLSQEGQDLATYRNVLSNYEILGTEFEELVKEYTSLKEKVQNHRWMLTGLLKI